MRSCGHMEGVRAEKWPPGVGTKSVALGKVGLAEMLTPSTVKLGAMSSSSSDRVSAKNEY